MCFDVANKQDLVLLQLWEGGSESFNISGSPFLVDWLVETQGLGRLFGRTDGVKRKCKDNDKELPRKRPWL